jgi:hypothetical protein
MDWTECRRNLSWINLGYNPDSHQEGQWDSPSPGRDSNPEPHRYATGIVNHQFGTLGVSVLVSRTVCTRKCNVMVLLLLYQ